jgi:hypothetical protein
LKFIQKYNKIEKYVSFKDTIIIMKARKRTMKKKIVVGLLCAGFVFVMGSCEIPQSISVKGSPGLYVPLGSPFKDGKGIESFISFKDVEKMMTQPNQEGDITFYDYPGYNDLPNTDKVQAYLAHCKITEMNLDLSEYVKALDIAKNLGEVSGDIPGTGSPIPIPISFGAMGNWITEVTRAKFTLTLTMSGSASGTVSVDFYYDNNPQGGAVQNFSGTGTQDLTFQSYSFTFIPSKGLTIQVQAPVGTSFKPQLAFDWASAKVKPNKDDATFEGSYTFTLGDITGYLGEGVTFQTIPVYMYMNIPSSLGNNNNNNLQLTIESNGDSVPGMAEQEGEVFPSSLPQAITEAEEKIDEPIDFGSGGHPYDFAPLLGTSDKIELDYKLTAPSEVSITKGDPNNGTITVDMVIVLPLAFKVSAESKHDSEKYVKLTLGGGLPDSIGAGDLFGRTGENKEDDLLNNIDSVKVILNNVQNTAIPGLVLVISATNWQDIIELADGKSSEFKVSMDKLPYPFSPEFELLLERENPDGTSPGTLKIGPFNDMKLDFSLAIEAKAKIDQKIEL